jgi:hypothetical protein
MANKIILDQVLPNNLKKNGEILFGEDLGIIISVLKGGVNFLKKDMDTLLSGKSDTIIVYDISELQDKAAINGEYAYVYQNSSNPQSLRMYLRSSDEWVFQREVSIENLYSLIDQLVAANSFKDVTYHPENGVLSFEKYDGTTKDVDLPLELIVQSGEYIMETKTIHLVLANEDIIDIPLEDLFSNIVTTEYLEANTLKIVVSFSEPALKVGDFWYEEK